MEAMIQEFGHANSLDGADTLTVFGGIVKKYRLSKPEAEEFWHEIMEEME